MDMISEFHLVFKEMLKADTPKCFQLQLYRPKDSLSSL